MKWVWFVAGLLLGTGLFLYAAFGSGEVVIVRGLAIAGPLSMAASFVSFGLDRSVRRKRAHERIAWHRGYALSILGPIGSFTAGFASFVGLLVTVGIVTLLA